MLPQTHPLIWRKIHVVASYRSGEVRTPFVSSAHRTLCSRDYQLRIIPSYRARTGGRDASVAHADCQHDADRFRLRAEYLDCAASGWPGATHHQLPGPDVESTLFAGRKMDRV